MNKPRILVIDSGHSCLRLLPSGVAESSRIISADSAQEGVKLVLDRTIEVVIADMDTPGTDAQQLLEEMRRRGIDVPVILLASPTSMEKAVDAINLGAFEFLVKPLEKEQLSVSILNALKMADLSQENRALSEAVRRRFSYEGVLSSSSPFRQVLSQAAHLAQVDTPVLLRGESGTGKELLAKAIHFNSRRRSKPFVAVNCGAIPEYLVEEDLFGHTKKGKAEKRKFERARSGTLFLDEIAEVPPAVQAKLLRILQEGETDAATDGMPNRIDMRIIAATRRDLQNVVRDGAFREDLYYRLSVAPLIIPSLRERPDDIPLLVRHFGDLFNKKFQKSVRFSRDAIDALKRYRWPGNVRELESVCERVTLFSNNGEVTPDDLPSDIQDRTLRIDRLNLQLPEEGISLEQLERGLLLAALEMHDWNQSRAARYLRLTRNTLIYRMGKYNLHPKAEKDTSPDSTTAVKA